MSDRLCVYLNDALVGFLLLDEGRQFHFRYTSSWVNDHKAIPLSLSLPIQTVPFEHDEARSFFSNLLPEAELRQVIARKLGVSLQNDYALLQAVGGECAGAVRLLTENSTASERKEYRAIDDEQLNELIDSLPGQPMLVGEVGLRLSLAGAQNKLPIYFEEGDISLPMFEAPSSHIMKPPMLHYNNTVQNEAFCMNLAKTMGLPVPGVCILHKMKPLYIIERYDRERDENGDIQRLHQEDFCQALNVLPNQKYEKEGGPTLKQCIDLLRQHSTKPAMDILNLLAWTVFNYLIGNADAHAKNISLLLTQNGPQLAPFYDLLCTAIYPELDQRMAMKIGGEDRPDWIIKRKWQRFADELGIGFKLVKRMLCEMADEMPAQVGEALKPFAEQHGAHDTLNKIQILIEQRCAKVKRFF